MAKKKHSVFSDLVRFLINGSLLITFGALLLLIYLPYSKSINASFKPDPKPMTSSYSGSSNKNSNENTIVNGVHIATGMIYDKDFEVVKAACTSCHSSKLITQNRATREGWKQMITWMQATQGLPDLGKNEPIILNYLAKHYAPKAEGRRRNLNTEEIDWYVLTLD
ncbi:MAG: hypothetical protein AAGA77_03430 [Bacteroidota bacterium]